MGQKYSKSLDWIIIYLDSYHLLRGWLPDPISYVNTWSWKKYFWNEGVSIHNICLSMTYIYYRTVHTQLYVNILHISHDIVEIRDYSNGDREWPTDTNVNKLVPGSMGGIFRSQSARLCLKMHLFEAATYFLTSMYVILIWQCQKSFYFTDLCIKYLLELLGRPWWIPDLARSRRRQRWRLLCNSDRSNSSIIAHCHPQFWESWRVRLRLFMV